MNRLSTLVSAANEQLPRGGRQKAIGWVLGAIVAAHLGVGFATTIAPDALVQQTARDVQQIIKQDPALQAGNRQKTWDLVEQKILPHFDFERMTMLAVGRDWRKATPEQQKALIAAFRSLLVRTYSGALSAYKDHRIEVQPVSAQNAENVAVRSQVTGPGTGSVAMDYRMHRTANGWKVHDVAVDGVSLVTTYRSSFKTEIDRSGFEGLIKLIGDKSARADGGGGSATGAPGQKAR